MSHKQPDDPPRQERATNHSGCEQQEAAKTNYDLLRGDQVPAKSFRQHHTTESKRQQQEGPDDPDAILDKAAAQPIKVHAVRLPPALQIEIAKMTGKSQCIGT